jgi:hypothetical protein
VRHASRAGWTARAPAIEMLDAAADSDSRADDDEAGLQARLRAMAAALGVLSAVPREM